MHFCDVFIKSSAFFVDIDEVGKRNDEFDAVGNANGAGSGLLCARIGNGNGVDFGELAYGRCHIGDDFSLFGVVAERQHLWNGLARSNIGFAANVSNRRHDGDERLRFIGLLAIVESRVFFGPWGDHNRFWSAFFFGNSLPDFFGHEWGKWMEQSQERFEYVDENESRRALCLFGVRIVIIEHDF